ncbi:hypothetical protein RN51_01637 [Microbacterium oxydans]|uniref:Uncharacterized protein n=1 Tax=Microbacterium oxydans TaxID=82380 RepID=A0A0F0KPQ8_9MICO|nr:hypothetical protein RN51_01637 [Microbacterium oxydans]
MERFVPVLSRRVMQVVSVEPSRVETVIFGPRDIEESTRLVEDAKLTLFGGGF